MSDMSPRQVEPWLTKRELARRLSCSVRTVERLGLPSMRVANQNRYLMSEVEAHLRGESNVVELHPKGRAA